MTLKRYPRTVINRLRLQVDDRSYEVAICFCWCAALDEYLSLSHDLHEKERERFDKMDYERRRKSYLLGRHVGRSAASAVIGHDQRSDIFIDQGVFHQPILVSPLLPNMQLSISHCDDLGAAIVFPEAVPMGIDIERICPGKKDAIESVITEWEKELARNFPFDYETFLFCLWSAKESISKVFKTGLTASLAIYEVASLERGDNEFTLYYKNIFQYVTAVFIIHHYVCAVTYPKNVVLNSESMLCFRRSLQELWQVNSQPDLTQSKGQILKMQDV
ncbi:phosphopantetheinyl transferase [Paenibacillus forsythiae]|uniref:Phosphopantetheinyl transferase n=1 Tax=Paenibacillus forsythiae TaxID=365616 RepID=A0ABU3H515_9BACL|nr:4'-phosphopantetheinyl transferase superfamily protein [Paenibacillus forsythiae]MDT3425551.1 phosphopantetheinyl transferase [Paenibacillus forsythiae]